MTTVAEDGAHRSEPAAWEDALAAGLLDDALENLVRQFARPLDCLRELVQNSMDAGSPRVDITVHWRPLDTEGVLEVRVVDYGEGMDEYILDHELTQMFASAKAGDLTKIGRFGIGFTSVFALLPEQVVVRTGRYGMGWELVFSADRSFDKVALSTPVTGTRVSIFKRIPVADKDHWVDEVRRALVFWCEHAEVPIRFDDQTEGNVASVAPSALADPFEAFHAPLAEPTVIQRPFLLTGAPWVVHHEADGVEVWAAAGVPPQFAWYNGGLTLLSTTDPQCLGSHAAVLQHCQLKIKYRRLEHTLTRDNVLQDAAWSHALTVACEAVRLLHQKVLLDATVAEDKSRGNMAAMQVFADAFSTGATPLGASEIRKHLHLPVWNGPAVPLSLVGRLGERHQGRLRLPTSATASALVAAMAAAGRRVLVDHPAVRQLVEATYPSVVWVAPTEVFLLVEPAEDAPMWTTLLDAAAKRVDAAGGPSVSLALCRIRGDGAPPVVCAPPQPHPMAIARALPTWLDRLRGPRRVWVNVAHPNVLLAAQTAQLSPHVGSLALLQLVLATYGAIPGRLWGRFCRSVPA